MLVPITCALLGAGMVFFGGLTTGLAMKQKLEGEGIIRIAVVIALMGVALIFLSPSLVG